MTSTKRVALALVVTALVFGFASVALPSARAASDSFSLYGSVLSGWGNSSATESFPGPILKVAQGDTVTITLHSSDGVSHEFFIDFNNDHAPSAGEPTSPAFNATTSVPTFTASQAGTFTYYCYFHEGSMKGTFVVTGSTTTGGSGGSGGIDGTTLAILGIVVVVVVAAGVGVLVMRRRPKQP